MRIYVKDESMKHPIRIAFPNSLLINGLTARMISKICRKSGKMELSPRDILQIGGALRTGKKLLKGRPLVEVEDKGDMVKIWL